MLKGGNNLICNFLSRNYVIILLVLIFILCIFSIFILLPVDCILKGSPVYSDDYSLHYYNCLHNKEMLLNFGKTWGYDPFLLAGYPAGVLFAADAKAWELLFFVLSFFFSDGFSFNFYIILFHLVHPFLLYSAARNFDFSKKESLISAFFSFGVLYFTNAIDFVYWGMISFVFVSYFSIFVFSFFFKWLKSTQFKYYLILLVAGSLLMLMHIMSPILVFIPSFVLYFLYNRKIKTSNHILLFILLVTILLINSFWLLPIVKIYNQLTIEYYMEQYTTLQSFNIFQPIKIYLLQYMMINKTSPDLNNSLIEALLVLFGTAGMYYMIKCKVQRKIAIAFLSGILFLFLVSYYGSYTNFFSKIQPKRFIIPLNILLIIPASRGLYNIVQEIIKGKSLIFRVFLICFAVVVIADPVLKLPKSAFYNKAYRLSCSIPDQIENLLTWIKKNTDNSGRILLEDSGYDTKHKYYGTHLPGLFPYYTQREFLCGPVPYPSIFQQVASFNAGLLFRKDVESFSLNDFKKYFDLYNVKWIICWSKKSINHIKKYPDFFIYKTVIDKFSIFEIKREASYFLQGSGKIKASYNRFQLNNVIPVNGEIIIKYHWMDNFKTNPPLKIEEFPVLDHPIGFIKVYNPPSSFEIEMVY